MFCRERGGKICAIVWWFGLVFVLYAVGYECYTVRGEAIGNSETRPCLCRELYRISGNGFPIFTDLLECLPMCEEEKIQLRCRLVFFFFGEGPILLVLYFAVLYVRVYDITVYYGRYSKKARQRKAGGKNKNRHFV